jgi:hypothetical protein
MASLTLALSENLRRKIKEFKYINWSEVARAAIIDKLQLLEKMDRLLSKSALTKKESIRYGRMIKKRQWAGTKKLLS